MVSFKVKLFILLPKILHPFGITFYQYVNPLRKKIKVLPYGDYWLIKDESRQILVPPSIVSANRFSNGINSRIKDIYEKYRLEPQVKVEEGDIVCDVGAFIGEFSMAVTDIADEIIAFEPDPKALFCLKKNVSSTSNVLALKRLLWESNKELDFKLSTAHADSSVLDVDSKIINDTIKMRGSRLDEELLKLDFDHIDFLKIEAEGAEYEVLKGAESILSKTKKIAVDCCPERYGKSPKHQVQNLLESHGLNTVAKNIRKPYPADMVYAWSS